MNTSTSTTLEAHDHHPRLAHHFDDMKQQFDAAKLGLWFFLATEILLFGGLFVLYVIFRVKHPGVFAWVKQNQFLDTNLGMVNTIVLIFSSLTMAMAVTYAQLGRRRPVTICLGITFLCAVIFMAIKSVEYEHKFHENLIPGIGFYEKPEHAVGGGAGGGDALLPGDPTRAMPLWSATCRSCHGVAGEGVEGQGKDIRTSQFILDRDDTELMDFIKVGRRIDDPLNTTGILMPPKGGNPLLKDQDLMDIIALVRTFITIDASGDKGADAANGENDASGGDAASTSGNSSNTPEVPAVVVPPKSATNSSETKFWIPRSSIPQGPSGPAGIEVTVLPESQGGIESSPVDSKGKVHHTVDAARPQNAHIFFGLYFMMTGLHGIHVLAGMGLIGWLLYRSTKGHFDSQYFTPIDLGGLYWHIVDIIWIFLFPMFYLM